MRWEVLKQNAFVLRAYLTSDFNVCLYSLWLFLFCVAVVTFPSAKAFAEPLPNDRWVAFGGMPGTNDQVNAVALKGGSSDEVLYLAGHFTEAGGKQVAKIAAWISPTFQPLAQSSSGNVYALAVLPDGRLVAGGDFTSINGTTCRYLALWDGTAWSSVGGGTNGPVYSLAIDTSGTLYVGGNFGYVGSGSPVTANNVAAWDGTSWRGLRGGTNGTVRALLWLNDSLYVGGDFLSAGGQGYSHIARWSRTDNQWYPLGAGTNGRVAALAVNPTGDVLYVGGEFTRAGTLNANYVAQWSHATWAPLTDGVNGPVVSLACDTSGNLYVGGGFSLAGGNPVTGLAVWDGNNWSSAGLEFESSPSGYSVNALAFSSATGRLFAGGKFTHANSLLMRNIAWAEHTTWYPLRPGFNGNVSAITISGLGDVYVGGEFTCAGDGVTTANRVAKWDGTQWSCPGGGIPSSSPVTGLAVDPRTGVLYASVFDDNGKGVLRCQGSSWQSLGTTYDGKAVCFDSSGTLYAAGFSIAKVGYTMRSIVGKWNGSAWEGFPDASDGFGYALLLGLPDTAGFLVGGDFTSPVPYLAKWSGTGWQPYNFTAGLDGPVLALLAHNSVVYAGGLFTRCGDTPLPYVCAILPSGPESVHGGVNWTVSALEADERDPSAFFAGGYFTRAGEPSIDAPFIVRGSRVSGWQSVGSGCDSCVHALKMDGVGNLWVGGLFTRAGGQASPRFALYAAPPFHQLSDDPLTTSGEQWQVELGYNVSGLAESAWSSSDGAILSRIYADPARYRVTGRMSRPALVLPYSAIGSDKYVRAKFCVYASASSDNWQTTGAMPNLRLRVSHRFSQTAMLEVYNHINVDPEASTRFGPEIRPSTDATRPSIYRVDMDPVDVPFLIENGTTEGISCGFEAYSVDPQDEGAVALTEVCVGAYPKLLDNTPAAAVYAPGASDAGNLAVRDAATDLSVMNLIPSVGVGEFPQEDKDPNSPRPQYSEGSWGVRLDTRSVRADRYGVIQREFWPGDYAQRIRVEPGKVYKIKYHIVSSQNSNRQSQMRLRVRSIRYLWCQKFEIGGAWGAGPENNMAAAQALPGVGCLNPDKVGDENGGWYTLIFHSPLDERIRPEFPEGTPVSVRMPTLSAEPGNGVDAYSLRDLRVCFDNLDTLSGSALRYLEEGDFILDRIEVRGYLDIAD